MPVPTIVPITMAEAAHAPSALTRSSGFAGLAWVAIEVLRRKVRLNFDAYFRGATPDSPRPLVDPVSNSLASVPHAEVTKVPTSTYQVHARGVNNLTRIMTAIPLTKPISAPRSFARLFQ